jgi:hypothetical protein
MFVVASIANLVSQAASAIRDNPTDIPPTYEALQPSGC